jgi:hypothetical protein
MSGFDTLKNLGAKVGRRVRSAHKPLVRLARRGAREREHRDMQRNAAEIDRAIAQVAAGTDAIIAGPWLAEVGYEVLYWIPFLRWFCDAHRVPRERLIVLSRGGMEAAYAELAASYVDIFDFLTPEELTRRGDERRAEDEGGGRKQSSLSALDESLLARARTSRGVQTSAVLHPSMMFGLFRHAWHGNLPMDAFWRRVRYAYPALPAQPLTGDLGLPREFVSLKLYTGHSLASSPSNLDTLRAVVERMAQRTPVVTLDTPFGLDEHRDVDVSGIGGVRSLAPLMTPRTNLAVQLAVIARASMFLGTCGGLAWIAPFLGVRTVGVLDDDRLLAPHLLVARQAGKLVGAAEFSTLDLRALAGSGILDAPRLSPAP